MADGGITEDQWALAPADLEQQRLDAPGHPVQLCITEQIPATSISIFFDFIPSPHIYPSF